MHVAGLSYVCELGLPFPSSDDPARNRSTRREPTINAMLMTLNLMNLFPPIRRLYHVQSTGK
jgi:hypothetical protein